jgi:outer membrane protein assembly factor BamB
VFIGAQDRRVYSVDRTGQVRFATQLDQDIDCAPSVGENKQLYVGTDGGSVAAMDTTSGKVLWRTTVGGHVRSGLTITRSHDVVAGVYGPSPRVVAVNGETGELLWEFAVPGTGAKEHGVHGSPVEDKDGNLFFGGQDNAIYSLSASGELRWKIGTGGDMDAPVVLVSDGVLLAASDDGKIYQVTEQ